MTAAALLREVGLLADGPVVWGRPAPARGSGVFVVELTSPLPRAPIELSRVGKWIERVPTLTLDGERPTSRALAARLASFWLPSQTVLYIGVSSASVGARIAAMQKTALGDRRPFSGGYWLHALKGDVLASLRVWWAATDATEEYVDALLGAFVRGIPADEVAALPDRTVVLPFANLRLPTGERRTTGVAGSLLADEPEPVPPPTNVTVVPDGDAEGARGEPPERRRRTSPASSKASSTGAARTARSGKPASEPVTMTADGAERLRAELRELTEVRRPEVIARIRTAKEHGDLKENAEYHAAREEQSFLEGRIQALEARLRDSVIADAPAAGGGADIGSRVTVEVDGETVSYTLVGAFESKPGEGRLSAASPVGRALLGADAGDEVTVETPRGAVVYRVVSVE
jgi:transcription elongation factor GreA